MDSVRLSSGHSILAVFKLDADGIGLFEQYEDAVLPLMREYGGRIERRVRSLDNALEVHLLWFPSEDDFERYKADPRRAAFATLFELSNAEASVYAVREIGGSP